jgi:Jacalin-like lectin domain/TIR domain
LSLLVDLPEIVGFFSYSRDDDTDSMGSLSTLRDRIQRELRGRLGRTKATFRLWQDTAAIPHGSLWEEEIKAAVAQSVFFIPIITPTSVRSSHCKREFELFLARERELGRSDLIFPLLYIRVPELENEQQWRENEVLRVIGTRQYLDWQERRYLDIRSPEVAAQIGHFCSNIYDALRGPAPTARGASAQERPRAPRDSTPHATADLPAPELPKQSFAGPAAAYAPARGREAKDDASGAASGSEQRAGRRRTVTTGMQVALLALVGVLATAVIVLWNRDRTPLATPTAAPVPAPSPAAPATPPPPKPAIRRSAAFGGSGGNPFDEADANPHNLPVSGILINVSRNPGNASQQVISWLQVQWGESAGPAHGQWAPDPSTKPTRFAKNEKVTRVDVNSMFYNFSNVATQPHWIAGLRIFTSTNMYSFGDMTYGPTGQCLVADGESLIGFFGRSGGYVDQLGCIFAKAN